LLHKSPHIADFPVAYFVHSHPSDKTPVMDEQGKMCHRLPGEVVATLSMETFKMTLDRALSNLLELKMSLLITRGWIKWSLNVPSNPNYFMIV